MTKAWRPKVWDKIVYYAISQEIYDKKEVKLGRKFFEAGADAILTALIKEGTPTIAYHIEDGVKTRISGVRVIIPEEDNE